MYVINHQVNWDHNTCFFKLNKYFESSGLPYLTYCFLKVSAERAIEIMFAEAHGGRQVVFFF